MAQWFYHQGGGALFDLGVYNVTSLCGFLGPVKRVTALVGTAIPERVVDGEMMKVEADDNAHVLLDFGEHVYASVSTGFTIQKYGHAPAIELYGLNGTMNMFGDDWAPNGFEQWRNEAGFWEVFPETAPNWPWTYGLIHLVDCIERGTLTVTRPEHAYHVLEVILAAVSSSTDGRAIEITSDFPSPTSPTSVVMWPMPASSTTPDADRPVLLHPTRYLGGVTRPTYDAPPDRPQALFGCPRDPRQPVRSQQRHQQSGVVVADAPPIGPGCSARRCASLTPPRFGRRDRSFCRA